MEAHIATLDGQLLRRGFWLYICVVVNGGERVFYVGRTGDSSSLNAASPFLRLGRHLDVKVTAKGATLRNQLVKWGWKIEECIFELVAFGPLHPEQRDQRSHYSCRDILAALERDVADALRRRGHTVLGNHKSKSGSSTDLLSEIIHHSKFKW